MYLPSYQTVLDTLADGVLKMKIPLEVRSRYGDDIKVADLSAYAKRLRVWLRKDITATLAKHLEGTSGDSLLNVASYLDPRFKERKYASGKKLEEARKEVKRLAVQFCEEYPLILQAQKKLAADPEGVSLAALAPQPGRKRKRSDKGVPKAKPKPKSRARVSDHENARISQELEGLRAGAAASSSTAPPRVLRNVRSDEEQMYGLVAMEEQDIAKPGLLEDIATEVERQLCVYALIPEKKDLDEGPLAFWKNHEHRMPHLAVVARQIFSVPASSANVERLFSAAGRAITRRRPRLQAFHAANLIYGHANVVRGVKGVRAGSKRARKA